MDCVCKVNQTWFYLNRLVLRVNLPVFSFWILFLIYGSVLVFLVTVSIWSHLKLNNQRNMNKITQTFYIHLFLCSWQTKAVINVCDGNVPFLHKKRIKTMFYSFCEAQYQTIHGLVLVPDPTTSGSDFNGHEDQWSWQRLYNISAFREINL